MSRYEHIKQIVNEVLEWLRAPGPEVLNRNKPRKVSPEERVVKLLEAAGYRIEERQTDTMNRKLTFGCKSMISGKKHTIYFINDRLLHDDTAGLAATDILLMSDDFGNLKNPVLQQNPQLYTIDSYTDALVNFDSYINEEWEKYDTLMKERVKFYEVLPLDTHHGLEPSSTDFVDNWAKTSDQPILMILGYYGAGKTWFTENYTYHALSKVYFSRRPTSLSDDAPLPRPRIPIRIPLHKYTNLQSPPEIFLEALKNANISLPAGIKTLEWLESEGRLLWILDGFDEMYKQAPKERSSADLIKAFSDTRSKILLTSRIEDLRGSSSDKESWPLEIAYLCPLDEDKMRKVLEKCRSRDWTAVAARLRHASFIQLGEFLRRPMIFDMLAEVSYADELTLGNLFERYIKRCLKESTNESTFSQEERLSILGEMAWEMHISYPRTRIVSPAANQRWIDSILERLNLIDSPDTFRTVGEGLGKPSFLIVNDNQYRFAHKSFEQYFIARKMAQILKDIESDTAQVIDVWKIRRISEIERYFLADMLDKESLWQLLEAIRGSSRPEVEYTGGNAAMVLYTKDNNCFQERDLSHMVIAGAQLIGANFKNSHLEGTDLFESDLAMANLEGAKLDQIQVVNTNIRDAQIEYPDELLKTGAVKERYDNWFGPEFADRQATAYGGTYHEAMNTFIKMILSGLKLNDRILDIMSGGGDVVRKLLEQKPNLNILMTDRNKALLDLIEDADDYPYLRRVRCEFPVVDLKKHLMDSFDIIIGKKWIHEIPSNQQEELLSQITACLVSQGRLLLWLDAADYKSQNVLESLSKARKMTNFEHVLNLEIEQSERGVSEFINLWAFVKDWYNQNTRERDRRYFISLEEIEKILKDMNLFFKHEDVKRFYYRLNTMNLNEIAKRELARAAKALERAEIAKAYRDNDKYDEEQGNAIKHQTLAEFAQDRERNKEFDVFCRFTEKHLFKKQGEPTILGNLLDAKQVVIKGVPVVEFSWPVRLLEATKS